MGRVRACPHRRRGSELHFCAKIGSSLQVKLHQNWTIFRKVALPGGFFYSCALSFWGLSVIVYSGFLITARKGLADIDR